MHVCIPQVSVLPGIKKTTTILTSRTKGLQRSNARESNGPRNHSPFMRKFTCKDGIENEPRRTLPFTVVYEDTLRRRSETRCLPPGLSCLPNVCHSLSVRRFSLHHHDVVSSRQKPRRPRRCRLFKLRPPATSSFHVCQWSAFSTLNPKHSELLTN